MLNHNLIISCRERYITLQRYPFHFNRHFYILTVVDLQRIQRLFILREVNAVFLFPALL